MNGYSLSREWFNFSFENPEKIKPNHAALYFFAIEHCNRLGWKEKFGLPTTMAMEAIGIKSYNTYINTLNELIEFGFLIMVEKSKNQYSSNIIALSNFDKATTKALDKAMIKHSTKQGESIDSINKQINKEQENKETSDFDLAFESFIEMRTKGKNTITDRAIELIKMKLNKLAPEDEAKKILILNQSVMNNWKDVYDLKKESKIDNEPHWKSFAR